MSKFRFFTTIGALMLVVIAFAFVPQYLANRISPHFDPAKVQEIKDRNIDQYNELIGNFNKAKDQIKQDAKNAEAWTALGLIADTFNDDKLAERAYKKAIELEPSIFLPKNNLAVIYKEQGRYDLAKDLYLAIIKDRPADTQVYFALAEMYASGHEGTVDDAKQILADGIKETNDSGLKEWLRKLENGEKI